MNRHVWRGVAKLAAIIILGVGCTSVALGSQHCINIDTRDNVTKVSYSSPDSLGAIVIMLNFGTCDIIRATWEDAVPDNDLNLFHRDGNRLTAACLGVTPALPPGQNVPLVRIHLESFGNARCVPDTFTNELGCHTCMCRLDAYILKCDVNFSHSDVPDAEEFGALPNEFSIGAYPNPFNPSMMIKYSVPKRSVVRIAVYNLLGQEVVRLTDSEHVPGSYYISWDAQQASGTYFIRMNALEFSEAKKVVLLK